jgi:hypothetical protein
MLQVYMYSWLKKKTETEKLFDLCCQVHIQLIDKSIKPNF